uniref:Uncharacterized protein n=1 Tax=Rhodococcus hoagii TaxID=43767 RepID=A0A1Z1UX53_RHOHA|nr:hypothetical protein pVAPN1572_0321 [Prescottella equi]
MYFQKRRRANAFRNAHFKRYEGRSTGRSIERSPPHRADGFSDALHTALISVRRRASNRLDYRRSNGPRTAGNTVRADAVKRSAHRVKERLRTAGSSGPESARNSA